MDGLRAVAVLGVIWAHVWVFAGNPALVFGSVGSVRLDVNRAISIVGSGVDLFFVISGFCMYAMYAGAEGDFAWQGYVRFLKRRWLRIAPAFYCAATAAALGFAIVGLGFPYVDLGAHLLFLHTVIPGTGGLAAPLWSLATEWHFYMLLPAIVWGARKVGFWWTMMACVVLCLAFRLWIYGGPAELLLYWKAQIPCRLVEFVWGICVARLYLDGRIPPAALRGAKGFIVGVVIAFAGRILMVTEVTNAVGRHGWLLKVFAEPVMSAGFAVLLWNVIGSESWFARQLSRPAIVLIGRRSYSLYLWHSWPTIWVTGELVRHFGSNVGVQYAALALSVALLWPLAWASFRALEQPYFEKRARVVPAAAVSGA